MSSVYRVNQFLVINVFNVASISALTPPYGPADGSLWKLGLANGQTFNINAEEATNLLAYTGWHDGETITQARKEATQ